MVWCKRNALWYLIGSLGDLEIEFTLVLLMFVLTYDLPGSSQGDRELDHSGPHITAFTTHTWLSRHEQ